MKYSSPQAYLNRYFKGRKKFNYTSDSDGNDMYESKSWNLVWVRGEEFILERRVRDFDTGADYFDECFYGTLIECVNYIKSESK
jgi:hypothetical protein